MTQRLPCPSCPWRVDQDASAIPHFSLSLAEALSKTCGAPGQEAPLGSSLFACHQSREGREVVCVGWLAMAGEHNLQARLLQAQGRLPVLRPDDTWPELHASYDEVIGKLRATSGRCASPRGTSPGDPPPS